MATELTREELFNQVWERPMIHVAADYGISDVALKKICTKHRIPVPGRGYWAKKAAGHDVKRAHFREVTDQAIARIVIHGSAAEKLPAQVKQARADAKARERKEENKVTVSPAPTDLHPVLARTAKRLEKAIPSRDGLVTFAGPALFDLTIGPDNADRVIAFLHAFVTAAAERGWSVVKGERALVFSVEDEVIDFKIVEEHDRIPHIPTEAERAKLERWDRDHRRRGYDDSSWAWRFRPTPPEWDHVPSGRLRVILNEGRYRYRFHGLRRSFGDGKTQRIEALANAILEAFATWAAAIKAKRVDDEQERIKREAEARRREEQRRREALEKKRVESLARNIDLWHQHQNVLSFVREVERRMESSTTKNDEAAVRAWLDWARGYADGLDPLRKGAPRLLQFDDFESWQLRY